MFERSRQGAVNVIAGSVPINSDHAASLQTVLEQCLADGMPRAVLHLHGIPLLDSTGLELLLDMQESFEQRGGALKLSAANPLCQDILRVSGMSNRFEMYDEVKSAIGSFLQ